MNTKKSADNKKRMKNILLKVNSKIKNLQKVYWGPWEMRSIGNTGNAGTNWKLEIFYVIVQQMKTNQYSKTNNY